MSLYLLVELDEFYIFVLISPKLKNMDIFLFYSIKNASSLIKIDPLNILRMKRKYKEVYHEYIFISYPYRVSEFRRVLITSISEKKGFLFELVFHDCTRNKYTRS